MSTNLASFTDALDNDEIADSQGSQPLSLPSSDEVQHQSGREGQMTMMEVTRPIRGAGQRGEFRSVEEIDPKYRDVFTYPYFNLIQSRVIDDALYSDKSMVVCAPTGSGKTVVFEMAVVQLLMELENKNFNEDFKIIYMAPVKALCTERLTEWYPKFTKLGLMCVEVTGDTDVDFSQLKPYRIIITTPEKWDMLTRRWRDHRGLVETIKLFLIDEVHILNDETRGPVLEAVVSRMKTIESSAQSVHRIEQLQKQYQNHPNMNVTNKDAPRIRFVAVSATINNPEDVAAWLRSKDRPAVFFKFGDECRPVKLKRIVEGYPCPEGTSIFKFDITLNYRLWPIIQKYHDGKSTLIFCNTRKSVTLTAEVLSRELTIDFTPEQKARLTALASTIKNKKLQTLVLNGVGCHHAGLLYEERINIEAAFRNRDLPILITTTTLAMGVNLPAHLVIIKNTQQYVSGAYQEYGISTILQMVGRAGRPQFDTEATAVIMTRLADKPRYQALVGGSEPLQSYLHKRLPENLNSEAALGTVTDVAQCVQWLCSTFLYVRAARDPKWYLGLPPNAPPHQISKKIEGRIMVPESLLAKNIYAGEVASIELVYLPRFYDDLYQSSGGRLAQVCAGFLTMFSFTVKAIELCVTAMNGLASSGLITMDEASCIESTEAGRLMSVFYLDLQTMRQIIKIKGTETLESLLWIICESHELSDMHLRVDERRCLNALNRNNAAATIRFPMKGKITTRQMKLNCVIQAILGCLPIPDPSLNQEAMKIMRIADRVCKCIVAYLTRRNLVSSQPKFYSAVLNSLILAKCVSAHLWENSPYVSKQLKGIGPTFSALLASAGKTNIMLLEESHPRDLERIMNKGAPAGNVIRKQVSLLPKYQLTMMPIDEKKVSIKLSLLNKEHLAENLDILTAGDRHKSYIVVGDSENYLLLLTAFQDNDLVSVYDGTITHEITRIHNFEHKILIHCISSNFVGLDVQDEYTFKNIEPLYTHRVASITNLMEESTQLKPALKQTAITDVYKQRKRKGNETDVTQSKEKKKRDNSLIDKFKELKKSFGFKSKKLIQDLYDTKKASNRVLTEMTTSTIPSKKENQRNIQFPNGSSGLHNENNQDLSSCLVLNTTNSNDDINYPEMNIEHMDDDDFMADECVDSILKKIENEISNKHDRRASTHNETSTNPPPQYFVNEKVPVQIKHLINPTNSIIDNTAHLNQINGQLSRQSCPKAHNKGIKRRINANTKSNFNFIQTIEKETDSRNEDDEVAKDNTFSETIKNHIEKLLLNTKTTLNPTDTALIDLLDDRNMAQAPKYCDTSVGKTDTKASGFISFPDKTQYIAENGTEKKAKFVKDNSRDYKDNECQLPDNCKQTTTQIYNLVDDLVDLSDLDNSKETTNNNLDITTFSNQNTENERLTLSEIESSRNTNRKSVSPNNVGDDNKTAIKFTDSHCKMKKVDIDEIAAGDQYSSASKFMQLNHNNENTQVNKIHNNILKYSNGIDIDSSMDYPIIDVTPEKNETKSAFNVNSTEGSVKKMHISEIESEKPGDHLVQRVSVSDTDHEYKFNRHGYVETDNINRYSFTATKIDVTSKNTEEFQIQYIRKLKVGVDCIKIVSKRKCQANNVGENVSEGNRSNYVLDTNGNFNDSNISSNVNINNKTKQTLNPHNVCKLMDTVSKPKFLTNNDNLNISHSYYSSVVDLNQIDNKIPSVIKSIPAMIDAEKLPSSQTIHYNNALGKEDNVMANSKKEVSDAKINDTNCKKKFNDTDTDNFFNKNCLKMESILDKHSKILKKSDRPLKTRITATQSLQESNLKKTSKEHNKRLFKIRDIHKLETPLPKSLIVDVVRSPRPSDNDVLPRIKEVTLHSQSSVNPPPRNKYTKQDCKSVMVGVLRSPKTIDDVVMKEREQVESGLATAAQQTFNYIYGENSNYEDDNNYTCLTSVSLPLETTEFNIVDQSMFDPKILLQSLSKDPDDNDIFPPPPQFCDDDINYSPTRAEYDMTAQGYYCDELTVTPQDADNLYHSPKEYSDVLNDTYSLLTPSKEIETWTLSREDEDKSRSSSKDQWEFRGKQPNPLRSFTVTRGNFPGDSSKLCTSKESSRQAKLCDFRFTPKSKMRI